MIEPLLRPLALAAATLLALSPVWASAQDRPIAEAIRVDGGDACVDSASLAARVAHWLDRERIGVEVRVELQLDAGSAPGASFTLHRRDQPPAQRTFPALEGHCVDRVDALALALAIALDPEAVSRRVEAEALADGAGAEPIEGAEPTVDGSDSRSAAEEGAEPTVAERDESATAEEDPTGDLATTTDDEPANRPARTRRSSIALGGGLLWGGLEAAAAFASLALDLAPHPALRLRIAGVLGQARVSALGTSRYEARLVGGELGLRAGGALGRWRLEGEVGLVVAAFLARGEGFGEDLRTRRPWVALAAGPRAEVELTEVWALALSADALVSLLRARVHVMDPNGSRLAAATTPAAGLRVSLEAIARF